nr:putative ribonuclease H-like domain-containing protein [Tanacetum cinerariifolium]
MEQPNPTFAKILIMDTGKFEQWKFRIQQYLQNEHYALWEVIEFGDSYQAPKDVSNTGLASEGSAKKKGRTITVTTEDMQKRRNDVKTKTTLLLALPDEHQLIFSKYKTAQELWAAILKTFGGNEATKKTKKNQLKQQYFNFKAKEKETLEQTFNRLQAIVSHLEFMDVEIEQDDLNQNGKEEVNTASFPTASTQVSHASAIVAAASFSHDTVCAYIASQSNGSHIKYKDINQIDEDDIEEMDIKWNMALLSMRADRFWKKTGKKITIQGTDVAGFDKSKVECFNCHKMGYFARECKAPRSQDRGWDWSYMENEEENHALVDDQEAPIKFALMAKSNSENEVEARLVEFKNQEIKFCEKIRGLEFNVESKNNRIKRLTNELEELKKEKEGLDSKLTGFQSASKDLDTLIGSQRSDKNKEGLEYSVVPPSAQVYSPPKKDMTWTGLPEFADDIITDYSRPLPSIESNSNDLQSSNSSVSKNEESSSSILSKPVITFVKAADSPTVIKTNKDESVRKYSVKYAEIYRKTLKSSTVRVRTQVRVLRVSTVNAKFPTVNRKFPTGNSKFSSVDLGNKGKADSGCSRHMTCNISYLSDYERYDGGYVSFGQGGSKITGIDYEEVFALVARIEAIRLFLAYASFMGFTVYQMDVKSAFLYGTINEEVYDPEFPAKVYKVVKAMYGLHQALRA